MWSNPPSSLHTPWKENRTFRTISATKEHVSSSSRLPSPILRFCCRYGTEQQIEKQSSDVVSQGQLFENHYCIVWGRSWWRGIHVLLVLLRFHLLLDPNPGPESPKGWKSYTGSRAGIITPLMPTCEFSLPDNTLRIGPNFLVNRRWCFHSDAVPFLRASQSRRRWIEERGPLFSGCSLARCSSRDDACYLCWLGVFRHHHFHLNFAPRCFIHLDSYIVALAGESINLHTSTV